MYDVISGGMMSRIESQLLFAWFWGAALMLAQESPPFQVAGNVEVLSDIVYSTHSAAVGDLYVPKSGSGPFAAVVYIHGGGKRTEKIGGTRGGFRRQAAAMAAKGFVGFSIEYRFLDDDAFPGCIYDAKAAVRWLRANAKRYRIDPDHIGAAGGSWGGYIVAFLGTTGDMPEFEGDGANRGFSSRVQAVAAFNPAIDLVAFGNGSRKGPVSTFDEYLRAKYSEDPALWAKASPMTHAGKSSASFLFLHGTRDTTVLMAESEGLMNKLRTAGVHAELFSADGAGHAFFHGPPWFEPTLNRMAEFLTKYLK